MGPASNPQVYFARIVRRMLPRSPSAPAPLVSVESFVAVLGDALAVR